MRRRVPRLILLAAAGATTLLAGCSSEISGSAAPGGEPRQLPDAEREESFCRDVPVLLRDITEQLEQVETDPESAVAALDDAVGRMEEVQPPDDVADAWDRLVAVWTDLRDLVQQVDFTDPTANQALGPELLEIQPELVDAGTAVDQWGQANC